MQSQWHAEGAAIASRCLPGQRERRGRERVISSGSNGDAGEGNGAPAFFGGHRVALRRHAGVAFITTSGTSVLGGERRERGEQIGKLAASHDADLLVFFIRECTVIGVVMVRGFSLSMGMSARFSSLSSFLLLAKFWYTRRISLNGGFAAHLEVGSGFPVRQSHGTVHVQAGFASSGIFLVSIVCLLR